MTTRATALLVFCSLLAASTCGRAQEAEEFADSALTPEQWQQRVQDARRRSEEFIANARAQPVAPPQPDKEDREAADQRARNDPSLQCGDIIATSRGLLMFVGRVSDEHRPGDFLPAPSPDPGPKDCAARLAR